ncbi:zf-TFIIB domain-containing protein [Cellulomonas sp. ACRRI]|uniref:TFIIB-type zinc ribbon-containing protein n=1 Tax=Cellulomonas sp. ACRRI TaxID=2918188 RepID=UPI001EF1C934|nr:zf-TFIIB domain-containing protein [Cellulomonas sp. ACRRI]MCG7286605.1 zf-TFIIB domain-containing protein [Cellulomonas sp. ACRRI]
MRCPTDGAELVMAERQGVEIDYCPSCRGIWLDRGELDKILDRAAGAPAPVAADPGPAAAPGGYPAAPGYGGHREPGYRDGGYREPGHPDDRYRDDRRYEDRRYDDRRDPRHPYGKKKKRESWLGDLLDFD